MDSTVKTRKMVEKGLVLDERGAWVSLVDKLNKERSFVKYLAAGKVLLGKRWVTIQEAKAAVVVDSEPVTPPGQSLPPPVLVTASPAETSFVNEQTPDAETTDETEISETSEIAVVPEEFDKQKKAPMKATVQKIKKGKSDDLFYDHSENETVFFKIDELPEFDDDVMITVQKAIARLKGSSSLPIREDVNELLHSFEEFDIWEKSAHKRQAVFLAFMSGVAAVIGCAAILFLMFI